MAKKEKDTLQYLQMPLPKGRKSSRMSKVAFGGLNKRYTLDSGDLTMECNISTKEYPYLTPSELREPVTQKYTKPLSMFAFDDILIVVYVDNKSIKIDYIIGEETYTGIISESSEDYSQRSIVQFNVYDTPTDPVGGEFIKKLLIFPDKCSMFMNIIKTESNPLDWDEIDLEEAYTDVMYCYKNGTDKYYYTVKVEQHTDENNEVSFTRHLVNKSEKIDAKGNKTTLSNMFYCDGMDVLMKYYTNDVEAENGTYPPHKTASHNYYYYNTSKAQCYRWVDDYTDKENSGWKICTPPTMPNIKYATVHLSRVFGVDDDRVYASGYNDYTNWNLDTIDEYNEANAWCSPSQANTKAGGKFTGITNYQGHIVCFKRDYMHEIYNTKNPFRLQDIYAEGAIDNRTIQDVDGKLIFVSEDDVKIYTGSNPRIIGYNLNMSQYKYAVSGTDNRNYYLYCEDAIGNKYLYVYDTFTDLWSEQSIDRRVLSFAHNKNGMYMLYDTSDIRRGAVLKMDTNDYSHNWSFETDLITNKTVNIKHIKKLQMLVELEGNMQVYILYDDEVFNKDTSHLVYSSNKTGRIPIRVKPRNTANYGFKLHFEGTGYAKIYELEIFVEAGGELYV